MPRCRSDLAECLHDLISERRAGCSLPQPFYTDPGVFAWDLERVFFRNWLLVGHVARIPERGRYFLYDIGPDQLIIARGDAGRVHASFNVCRHRGSRICSEKDGRANSLACPYHAWTYALDGRLLGAPAMCDDFDRSQFGLRQCPVRIEHGLIYVYLGEGEPPNLDASFAAVDPYLRPYRLAEAKMAARIEWTIHANWKLVVENFAECYHCGPAHPEYCSVMEHTRADVTKPPAQVEAFRRMTEQWEDEASALGHFTGAIPPSSEYPHCASRMPVGYGRLSQSRTGEPLAPLMGDFTHSDGGYTSMRIHPGSYALGPCDHMVVNRFTPLTVDSTLQEMTWLVHPDAVEGRDYDPEELTWLWRVTTDQDLRIIEDNHKGVCSRAYVPGPYSNAEQSLDLFVTWYFGQIGDSER